MLLWELQGYHRIEYANEKAVVGIELGDVTSSL
jgi:hypothetical protein